MTVSPLHAGTLSAFALRGSRVRGHSGCAFPREATLWYFHFRLFGSLSPLILGTPRVLEGGAMVEKFPVGMRLCCSLVVSALWLVTSLFTVSWLLDLTAAFDQLWL